MARMDSRLIEKFLNDTCTPEEAARVLRWFDTAEGQDYLEKMIDADIERFEESNLHLFHPELDSEQLFAKVEKKIRPAGRSSYRDLFNYGNYSPMWRVAAILLLGFLGSLVYYARFYEEPAPQPLVQNPSKHYQTGADEQRLLSLADGTQIRLNSNSKLWIADDFFNKTREVRMEGEAFFDVASNPDKPFIITTELAEIRVLGTSFNVKSEPTNENVQVAVVEGNVSVSSRKTRKENDRNSVVLGKGQFGYLDRGEFNVENFGIENYLYWINGRLVFENLTLSQVCTQLTRLYEVQCRVESDSIKDLKLTTNISSVSSLEKVLSVISLSLDVNYKKRENEILWFGRIIESNSANSSSSQERR